MSVATAATEQLRQDLVQKNLLDPQHLVVFGASSAGDGTGNTNTVTATMPDGHAAFIVGVSGAVSGIATASNILYRLLLDGTTSDQWSDIPRNVDVFQRYRNWAPTPLLWVSDTIAVQVQVDNVNGETLAGTVIALLWDLQIARNIPQRFFWPQTLG